MSLVAPQHVESSWTRARTHVPCIGRRILNPCTTREVPGLICFKYSFDGWNWVSTGLLWGFSQFALSTTIVRALDRPQETALATFISGL